MNASDPIRIAFVISAINTEQAGTEGHLLRLIRRLDRSRFEPQLIVLQRSAWTDQFNEPDIPIHVLEFKSFMRPKGWLVVSKLARIFKSAKTQVVDLHFVDAHFAGSIAARLAKTPVVLSNRRDMGYHYGAKGKMMVRLGNQFVTRFVANASVVADSMSQLERVPRERFEVIYNGIDLTRFDVLAQEPVCHAFKQFAAGKRVVSIAANLRPVKRLDVFLDAAAAVAAEFDDVVFALMGDGDLRADLEQQANHLGIRDRVLFLGSVPSTAPYLQKSDVGCLSSESEGFSNSVVECMAASLPVVVTKVGGLPEAISDAETGLVAMPNDARSFAEKLKRLLEMDDTERRAMGAAGRQRVVDMFSMERHIETHSSLFERELRSHSS